MTHERKKNNLRHFFSIKSNITMGLIQRMWSIIAFGLLLVSWKLRVLAAPNCALVVPMLAPCIGFMNGQEPSNLCCMSVENLTIMGKTKDDRVAMCECIKQVARLINYDPKRLPLLPKKCRVNSFFPPIDSEYDCGRSGSFFLHICLCR
ncbi:putative plant non-specific lipid-transfer protein/Par allergen [Helianthus annuus]|nr:putative plant non-specific lipid-transfer protein/Par allergen [Helianthus annuus]KAJ0461736.1 putative plant non-specific lipid-transfer protein/Par allergen [Helianthus annuus]KAJ0642136.1 putative plant non-specific lipid-transfer protein/Par allergen [Helianthus annuus]KAJ0646020.1 putative plant non-specific lipid-transfer protein/Par allergen [Helianthus annuus]